MKHHLSFRLLSASLFCFVCASIYAQTPVASWGAFHYYQSSVIVSSGKVKTPWMYGCVNWSPQNTQMFELEVYDRSRTTDNYIHLFFRPTSFSSYNGMQGPKPGTYTVSSDVTLYTDYYDEYWEGGKSGNCVIGYGKDPLGMYGDCPFSSYIGNYTATSDKVTKKTSINGKKVVVEVGAYGDMYFEIRDGDKVMVTIGDKAPIPTEILLSSNLQRTDNTSASTPNLLFKGEGLGDDNDNYYLQLAIKTNQTTGTFTISNVDISNTVIIKGASDLTIQSVDSLQVSTTPIGEYRLFMIITAADNKQYAFTGYYPDCPPAEGVVGTWCSFSYGKDNIKSEQITDSKSNPDWTITTANKFLKVWAKNNSKSSDNYIQLFFYVGSNYTGKTQTYANGLVGPKVGTYKIIMPRLSVAGYYADPYVCGYASDNMWYITTNYIDQQPIVVGNTYHFFSEVPADYRCPFGSFGSTMTGSTVNTTKTTSFNNHTIYVREGKNGNMFIAVCTETGTSISIGELPGYSLTINVEGNGHVDRESLGCENATGNKITLTPVADTGWSFQDWTAGCTSQVSDNHDGTFTYTVGNSDCSLTAKFLPGIETTDYQRRCDLPFTWNGYTISGIEDNGKKFKTRNWNDTQDSTVTLALTILSPLPDITYNRKICKGDTYSDEHFSNITTAGSHSQTYKYHDSNCDSLTYILKLSLLPDAQHVPYEEHICEGDTYSDEHFSNITTAGLHTKNIPYSGYDCDSIVYELTLHVWSPTTSEKTTSICSNTPLPYVWDNITFTRALDTDTTITLKNGNCHGCDSIVIRHLRIKEFAEGDTSAYYCHGASFEWFGTQYTVADMPIQRTFRSIFNCDSIVTLHLKEMDETITNIYEQSICEGEKYTDEFFTEELDKSDIYEKHIPFANTDCDSVYCQLSLTVNAHTTSEATKTIEKEDLPITWDGIYFTTFTDTTILLSGGNAKGCDSTIIRHLIRKPCLPLKANVSVDTICANQKEMHIRLSVEEGEVISCNVTYPNQEPNLHFRDSLNIPLSSEHEQTIVIPFANNTDSMKYIRPNTYPIAMEITDDCEQVTSYNLTLHVLYPSWLLLQRWNDMIMLLNENYNGGYTFSNIQWYHNGTGLIDNTKGDNNSYIYVRPQLAMGANDYYWAELTRTDDGQTICTCKLQAVPMSDDIVFDDNKPQEVIGLSTTTLDATHRNITVSSDISGTYRLYSANGMHLQEGLFGPAYNNPTIAIESGLPTGAYILLFRGDEGFTFTQKILVK